MEQNRALTSAVSQISKSFPKIPGLDHRADVFQQKIDIL